MKTDDTSEPSITGLSAAELETQYIKLAEQNGRLAELCRLNDYDPAHGAVPEHWKPLFMPFFKAAVELGATLATKPGHAPK